MVSTHESTVKVNLKKKFLSTVFLIFLFFVKPRIVSAEILINEFSSNSTIEWVELYNSSTETIDLTNWTLSDQLQTPEVLTGNISGGSFFVFEKSAGWLNNNDGDSITLKDSNGLVHDTIVYGRSGSIVGTPDSDKSAGRTPNGSSNWQNNLGWTKSSSNPDATPTPSPTPSPTSTTSPTPSPSISPSPSPLPSKTPSPSPVKSPSPKPSPISSISPEENLGRGETLGIGTTANDSPSPKADPSSNREFPLFAVSLIGGGLLLVGFASFLFFKSYKKEQNHTTEELL